MRAIFASYRAEESKHVVAGYMESGRQPHLNSHMRDIVVDWLVLVHGEYRLQAWWWGVWAMP